MSPIKILRAMEKHLERNLQLKPSWGKNEVLQQFHKASALAMAELLEEETRNHDS